MIHNSLFTNSTNTRVQLYNSLGPQRPSYEPDKPSTPIITKQTNKTNAINYESTMSTSLQNHTLNAIINQTHKYKRTAKSPQNRQQKTTPPKEKPTAKSTQSTNTNQQPSQSNPHKLKNNPIVLTSPNTPPSFKVENEEWIQRVSIE